MKAWRRVSAAGKTRAESGDVFKVKNVDRVMWGTFCAKDRLVSRRMSRFCQCARRSDVFGASHEDIGFKLNFVQSNVTTAAASKGFTDNLSCPQGPVVTLKTLPDSRIPYTK